MFTIEITWLLIVLSLTNFTDLLKCMFNLSVSISEEKFILNIMFNLRFRLCNPSWLAEAHYEYRSVGYPGPAIVIISEMSCCYTSDWCVTIVLIPPFTGHR